MKNGVMKKMKYFIVSLLAILIAGMTLLGVIGFNNTVDYSDSYEVNVSVELDIDKAKTILKETAENYFEQNGIKIVSSQVQNNGMNVIYKLKTDETAKISGLQQAITNALEADAETKGNEADVSIKATYNGNYMQTMKVLIAFGISIVAIFVYMLIMNKFASAIAVVCSSIVSVITFVAMVALVRIQALPFIESVALFAGILSAVLSVSTVGKYREEIKNLTEKTTAKDIVNKVSCTEFKKYLVALVACLIAGIAVIAFMLPYMMILGTQIIIAGLVSIATAYFVTPLIWTAVKGKKNIKN